jgi:hypothetical protein
MTRSADKVKDKSWSAADDNEPIHMWFNLSYSNYLCLPRSVLQSTPVEWQRRFVQCLEELSEMIEGLEDFPSSYKVQAQDGDGKFAHDPYSNYDRGRRKVELRASQTDGTAGLKDD